MTAEIAIMNREAIALASDSAVTMIGGKGQKIFTSANKLFSLSKYCPVGVMVYGNADFMGVPWETIIKVYRKKLGTNKFATIKDYGEDFIKFLDDSNRLFPYSEQKEYLRSSIYGYLRFVKEQIESLTHEKIDVQGKISSKDVKMIISDTIDTAYDDCMKTNNIPSIPETFNENLIKKHKKFIDEQLNEIFENAPLSKKQLNQLRTIVGCLFSKFPPGTRKTGYSDEW